uniref:Uncharacterized protein n=1 Tax=Glossina morsitans morsitans TaxID=37546 RepID=A0A1B0ESR0_GLOMM
MATLCISKTNTTSLTSEPIKVNKFFNNSSSYQSKIQQLISLSFTSWNFLFITFILSISKLCTIAAAESPHQTGAAHHPTNAPNFLMTNGSALLEKLNAFRVNTLGPPTNKNKTSTVASSATENNLTVSSSSSGGGVNGVGSAAANGTAASASFFGNKVFMNMDIKFLNVSGKIGTRLGIDYPRFSYKEIYASGISSVQDEVILSDIQETQSTKVLKNTRKQNKKVKTLVMPRYVELLKQ